MKSLCKECWGFVLAAGILACIPLLAAASPGDRGTRTPLPPGTQLPCEAAPYAQWAIVNFEDLAARDAAQPKPEGPPMPLLVPAPRECEEEEPEEEPPPPGLVLPESQTGPAPVPEAASPGPTTNYLALEDMAIVGSSYWVIPPDTDGAVGLSKVMVALNNNYRIQDKAAGTVLSTVAMSSFWSAAGGSGYFDPRTLYDPYNSRWIVAAVCNSGSANSAILVGVSQTSDPSGLWYLFRVDADSTNVSWADFPTIGFNKNWVAINVNLFNNSTGSYTASKMLVADYPQMRAGVYSGTFITGTNFCASPVATYSSTENTLYAANHLSSAGATYRVDTITGTPSAPTYTTGTTKTRTGGAWAQISGNILPQAAPLSGTSSCGSPPCKLETQDVYIRSTPVMRAGYVYYSQTVGLPSGGYTHTAVQWTKVEASTGNYADGGRVEDPTATSTNGGKWYAYPHIAVNQYGDMVLGFSQFASDQYVASGYTVHARGDAAGVMNDPYIYKAGEDYYNMTFSGSRNRWGDYSKAQVDPSNDTDLWILDEYAKARTGTDDGTGVNSSRWSTWWARLAPTIPSETAPGTGGTTTALAWTSKTAQTWQVNAGATSGYRVYRGIPANLPDLLNSNVDCCLRGTTASWSTHTLAGLDDDPSSVAGRFYWYLVVGASFWGEGSAGNATAGARVLNSTGTCRSWVQ